MKLSLRLTALLAFIMSAVSSLLAAENADRIVVAYVTSSPDIMPDPTEMTHINYAFGHVNETFDGVKVDNPERLARIAALKKQKPELKVLLSVGGWCSGRFSEMASTDSTRRAFAADCRRVADTYGLDGIDIDWEYPTSSESGISSSPDDTENFTKLMRDLREALGPDRMLTMASVCSAKYVDFPAILPYTDFINVMAYDMARVPLHSSPLYRSERTGMSADEATRAHLVAGVPREKIVLGLPFYGRGRAPYTDFIDFRDIRPFEGCTEEWDSVAMAPYMANSDGELVLGFDNPRSMTLKLDYILDNSLRGAMYWDYHCDDDAGTLRRLVARKILGTRQP